MLELFSQLSDATLSDNALIDAQFIDSTSIDKILIAAASWACRTQFDRGPAMIGHTNPPIYQQPRAGV
jgi:hypothetical protein